MNGEHRTGTIQPRFGFEESVRGGGRRTRHEPAGLAVDHESVYWAYRIAEPSPAKGGIARIAKDAPGVDDAMCLSK